jgi:cell division protease FtsH
MRRITYSVALSASAILRVVQSRSRPTPISHASAWASLDMSISAIGVLRHPPRWRSFSRIASKTTDNGNKAAVLRATTQSAHPPPPPPPHQYYHQYHHHHHHRRQDETSIRSAIRSLRAGTGGYVEDVRYSRFLELVGKKQIERVTFNSEGTQLVGLLRPPGRRGWFSSLFDRNRHHHRTPPHPQRLVRIPNLPNDPALLNTLTDYNVDISVSSSSDLSTGPRAAVSSILRKLLGTLSFFAWLFFLFRRSSGYSSGSPLSMARMKPSFNFFPNTNVTFDDVAGCDGAKLELSEVVDFLKQPQSYTNNGCVIPRGVLLHGPPGTGKTLLAKAVAGEAGVPFVSISGSEFVELYVGVGASRVRELFFQAKKNSPCIVFLDEIDAVGRQRGAGYAGGNDEREQTINQILVEMDGFDGNVGVITLAATNRLDVLDEALLRPGRFDRKVAVELPDVRGRTRILSVHARGKPLEPDVDLDAISRRTPGFSGAELENLMNEAALATARRGKSTIGWEEVDGALDRLMVGMEKRGGTSMLSRRQVEIVSYHEAGHAICGALIPDYDQVQKISIIPRSNGAGGLTFFSPEESRLESGMYSKQYLESQLVVALGGRVAEEIIFGEDLVTTGASNDLHHVAGIAKQMVKEFGMSNLVGRVALSSPVEGGPFMGRQLGLRQRNPWGSRMMGLVDSEVERLVNNAYLTAKLVLTENIELLHHLAYTLAENEVVTAEEFQMMVLLFDAKVCEYKLMGDDRNRDHLPFKRFPKNV